MEGSTIHFCKALLDDEANLTWEVFKDALLERYGGIREGDVFEQLASLQQEGGVVEYMEEFERLVAQVPRIPDAQYMGYFPHGSREGIRDRVRSLKTMGLLSRTRLMYLAHVVEAVEGEVQEKPYRGNHISGSRDWASQTRFNGSPGSESSVTGHT